MSMNTGEPSEVTLTEKERCARENHSEIERRRRNKMTHYINELADMVPQCAGLGRRPDKLTILRMAVSHMKAIRSSEGCCDSSYRPSFLTDQELKHLVLEAANGFMFVVGCESGKVLFVADSIYPAECIGHSIYDIVHPEDVDKVREQLSNFDSTTLNRVLDFKAGSVKKETSPAVNRVHMTCRRGFMCRMKLGQRENNSFHFSRLSDRRPIFSCNGNQYVVVHCTGYVKRSLPQGLEECTDPTTEQPYCQERCLICIGRLQISSMPISSSVGQSTQQFTVRFSEDGKFTFVDGSVYAILGYKPHELIGFYWWDKVHPEDQASVRDLFAQVLKLKDHTVCVMNRFRSKYDEWVSLRSSTWTFFNPFSEEFEFVIGTHTCVSYVGEGKPPPKEVEQSTEGCSIVSSEFIPSYRVGPTNNAVNPVTSSHWFASTPSEQEGGYAYGQPLRHTNPSYELDTSVRNDVSAVHNLFTQRDYPSPAFPQVDIDSIGSQNLVLASQSEEWNVNYLPESLQMSTAPKYASAPCNQMQPSTPPNSSWWTNQRNDVAYDRSLISIGERYIPQ
ncbi:PAS 11 and HLH domain containing protein [Trichuris trichiura]|uniref:Aryl hydrocarbon receptor nuclear translocator homolog n=1 Tax=Trichuris trichiura TaxID=36087 RepID=A0A077Z2I8_TRITR|nr:PAS 11 and HLH domain containing protein [Trichuris trichiura]